VWIGERHACIVCTFDQPLLGRHGVVRGRLGPVDVELRRFQRRHHRELLGACVNPEPDANPDADADPNAVGMRNATWWHAGVL
jgi:hypothetical protein